MARTTDGLKSLIRDAIREERDKPPLKPGDWIRASGLSYLCAREEVLCARLSITRPDVIDSDLMLIFEHGNALHWVLQNRILPATKTLLGRWLCVNCGAAHGAPASSYMPDEDSPEREAALQEFQDNQMLRPVVCPECDTPLDSDTCLYEEQHIHFEQYLLQGHPDGYLRLEGMPGLGILEVKSISSRGAWEVRNCAKLDHVTQTQTYMWKTGCRWGLVLYWDKGVPGMKALIPHIVEYDEDQVGAIRNLVRDIREGVADPSLKLPDRICGTVDCKRASLCGCAEACFEAM